MAILIVERSFEERLEQAELERLFSQLGPCLEQYGARWIHSYVAKDGKRMLCAFEAADAETVRLAHRTAGVGFERVWSAERLAPED